MNNLNFTDLSINGLKLVSRKINGDSRGYLTRIFCNKELHSAGWNLPIAQINLTVTEIAGTIRGMHFQLQPHSEMKIVTCLDGEIWDVVVDIRKNSPTFLNWHAEILSKKNQNSLLIPEGFAHGFQALKPNSKLLYLHSKPYNKTAESGLRFDDPSLNILWPRKITICSDRDLSHPILNKNFKGL